MKPEHDADYLQLQQNVAALIVENERLRSLCSESVLQIVYMHEKFQETGSGNNLLARLEAELACEPRIV